MSFIQPKFDEVYVGEEVPGMTFHVTQEQINQYGEFSGGGNPLHTDESFAKQTPFKGTIAQGVMTLAFVSQVMMRWDREGWMYGGEMDVTFTAPVRPNDDVMIHAKVINKDVSSRRVSLQLDVFNQRDERIIVGTTSLQF